MICLQARYEWAPDDYNVQKVGERMKEDKKKKPSAEADDLISNNNKIIAKYIKYVKGATKDSLEVLRSIENERLLEAVLEFAKNRSSLKKPMTALAIKKLLNRLDRFYDNDSIELKVETLNKSIEGCWQGVYPLSETEVNRILKKDRGSSFNLEDVYKKMVNRFD